MTNRRISVLTCGMAALALANTAWGLNNRSWVATSGSDQFGFCSEIAPCKTFQHAHDVTIAGGEVDVLSPGDYGPLTITKAITIDGGDMAYIQIFNATGGIQVNALPNDEVVLRNLSITTLPQFSLSSTSIGIQWNSGKLLTIENVAIEQAYRGIWLAAPGSSDHPPQELFLKDIAIRNCGQYGILVAGFAAGNFVSTNAKVVGESIIVENILGTSVYLSAGSRTSLRNAVVSYAQNAISAAGELNLENSSVLFTQEGLAVGANAVVRIGGNNFHDNDVLFANAGQIISFGDNRILGNGSSESPTSTVGLK